MIIAQWRHLDLRAVELSASCSSSFQHLAQRSRGILIFAQWNFRHLVQARFSIFQKHLSKGHMPTAQLKKSHCGCKNENGSLVTPGRCPNCEPSYALRKSLHGGHALCGCTTSRGNAQRFDRCKTCNLAGPSVSLVHKTSVKKRTAGAAERVYTALPEVFCLALSLSRSLLLLSSLSPCSLSRALCPVSLSSSVLHALRVHSYTCAKV